MGMGLILVGVVPTAFALNRTPDLVLLDQFRDSSAALVRTLYQYSQYGITVGDPLAAVADAVRVMAWTPQTRIAMSKFLATIDNA